MSASESRFDDWQEVLLLMVHDLRNPVASIGANVSFLRELGSELSGEDQDVHDAIRDMDAGVAGLRQGFDHLAWVARWLRGHPATSVSDGDAAIVVQRVAERAGQFVRADVGSEPLRAKGGGTLPRALGILLANSREHARGGEVVLHAFRDDEGVVVEVRDEGPAVAPELREVAFTVRGQPALKARPDGRYGHAAGLLAARALAEAMGGTIEAGGRDGQAWFRLRLQPL